MITSRTMIISKEEVIKDIAEFVEGILQDSLRDYITGHIETINLFNQYAAPNTILSSEIVSFDQYWGHPQTSGMYHYHVEPLYLTTVKATKSSLLGFLLDGFPVYGPQEEDGATVTTSMLDAYHGHTHVTVDYPNGIYHYHFTADAPYMNGSGFYGTPGTITQ